MAEVTITINGRHYDISCDPGQEGRIIDLAGYIDQQINNISQTGAAYNDSHLQILTLLVVADELFEAREKNSSSSSSKAPSADGSVSDAQIKKLEKVLRDEMQAEYAERLNTLQNQLANSNQNKSDAKSDEKDVLKIIKHLNERVSGLAVKVDSL
tara:strand:- start:896 stop:1360 length:465 start_codon:yes stop_codon:yes gene_type:complete